LTKKGPRPEEIEAARKDVQAAEATLVQAEGMLAQMREMLSHTVIKSPVTGILYERNVEPGEVVSSGGSKPLLRVADLGSVYLEATVPERLAHKVTAGQRVSISLRTAGGGELEGRVERLVSVADPASRDFLVRVSFPNSTSGLRPGTFAQARILVQEHDRVVAIPKDALVNRGGKYVVFAVQSGKAAERPVEVGLTDRTRAEVLSGVSPGETIVIIGAQALKNGDALKVGTSGGA
jgi:RND family efflux transporter MFP subunit